MFLIITVCHNTRQDEIPNYSYKLTYTIETPSLDRKNY